MRAKGGHRKKLVCWNGEDYYHYHGVAGVSEERQACRTEGRYRLEYCLVFPSMSWGGMVGGFLAVVLVTEILDGWRYCNNVEGSTREHEKIESIRGMKNARHSAKK